MTEPFYIPIGTSFPPVMPYISRGCSFHTVLTGPLISIALLFMRTTVALFFIYLFSELCKGCYRFCLSAQEGKITKYGIVVRAEITYFHVCSKILIKEVEYDLLFIPREAT
jgi:hypothetical protein